MLLKQETLRGVAEGRITLVFRRWRRPTGRPEGTLLTSAGLLSIDSVDRLDLDDVTGREAEAAGFSDLETLRLALCKPAEGSIYRITLHLAGPDPRIALREQIPEGREELEKLHGRLARWDAASKAEPWTHAVMSLLGQKPGTRAADPCTEVGMERDRFKANVRKLKGLGLTESLEVGYRLSPRREAVLRFVHGKAAG